MDQELRMMESIEYSQELFEKMLDNKDKLTKEFRNLFKNNPIKRVYLSGHGSPYNATYALKLMFENLLKVDATTEIPTLFNNHEGFNVGNVYKNDEMLLVCPAGTGKTKGPVLAAEKAKELGIKVISSSTNDYGRLVRASDVHINKMAGEEINFPDCKGHMATLFLYAICIIETANDLGRIDNQEYSSLINDLKKIIKNHHNIINDTRSWYLDNKEMMVTAWQFRIIGNGINYSTAIEGALKLSESTGIPAFGWELEQYLHGPILSLDQNNVFVVIGSEDIELAKTKKVTSLIKENLCENTVFICSDKNKIQNVNCLVSSFVDNPTLSALEYIVPLQVISTLIALDRGHSTVDCVPRYENISSKLETRFED